MRTLVLLIAGLLATFLSKPVSAQQFSTLGSAVGQSSIRLTQYGYGPPPCDNCTVYEPQPMYGPYPSSASSFGAGCQVQQAGCCDDNGHFIQLLGGYYWQSDLGPDESPPFDFVKLAARLGTRPIQNGGLLEQWSVMLELNVQPIVEGPGTIFGGFSLLTRMDLVDPDSLIVPYGQLGAGVVFTDAHQDMTQRAIGQFQEFLLQAHGGMRFKMTDNWTFDVEAGWEHVSNANLAERNGGTNGLGFAMGLTREF